MRVLLVVNTLLLGAIFISLGREAIMNHRIDAEIERLQHEADTLSARNTDLQAWKKTFQTESAIEQEARLKLGLKKPGETLVVVQDTKRAAVPSDDPSPAPAVLGVVSEQEESESLANAKKWWYYFFTSPAL